MFVYVTVLSSAQSTLFSWIGAKVLLRQFRVSPLLRIFQDGSAAERGVPKYTSDEPRINTSTLSYLFVIVLFCHESRQLRINVNIVFRTMKRENFKLNLERAR